MDSDNSEFFSSAHISKSELIDKFGKDLKWKVEESEFSNLDNVGGLQTADIADEESYPQPTCRYRIVVEKQDQNIEETYYWFLNFLRVDMGFPQVDKIYDVFSASDSSAFGGVTGQRAGIIQDRASQNLRGISELVKTLFQIVRELRLLDERLEPYYVWDKNKSADITLKGIFASLVEGGGNNPDSIYSLASKIGFTVLPDLFMNTHVYKLEDIDKVVDEGSTKEFNNVVKAVLKRKLYGYINWKLKTQVEFESRRKFQIQYLRQHWHTIRLYMSWARPYLKAARRLSAQDRHLESPDLISAFDSTRIDIEILAKKPLAISKENKHYGCIVANFSFKSKPNLTYKPEMQQQMPSHIGSCQVTLRSYGWHEKDIIAYKKLRQQEDLELLKLADIQVGSAFEALKAELEKYLDEAENSDPNTKDAREKKKKEDEAKAFEEMMKEKKKKDKFAILEPFTSIVRGVGELGGSFFEENPFKKEDKKDDKPKVEEPDDDKRKKAAGTVKTPMWITYNVYKKAHRLLNW
jgi:hypothetical protein